MLTLAEKVGFVSSYVSKPVLVPDEGQLASIVDVTGCRWPVRDDPEFIGGKAFCNHAQEAGSSYCPYHRRKNRSVSSATDIAKTTRQAIYVYERKIA